MSYESSCGFFQGDDNYQFVSPIGSYPLEINLLAIGHNTPILLDVFLYYKNKGVQ